MSEWRGILHPRDRRGQFRQSLERLAAGIEPGQKVEHAGGKIGRNRRGYWTSEVEGHPKGVHKSARSAVTRTVGVGAANPGVGNVRGYALPGEKSKITPKVRAHMETRNIAYATGFKGDRVASAADALVQLYRAQEGEGSGAAALKRVNETWRGLDPAERSRARRVAQHMHDAGSNLLRPRQTRVA